MPDENSKTFDNVTEAHVDSLKQQIIAAGGTVTGNQVNLHGLEANFVLDPTGGVLAVTILKKSGLARFVSDDAVFHQIETLGGLTASSATTEPVVDPAPHVIPVQR